MFCDLESIVAALDMGSHNRFFHASAVDPTERVDLEVALFQAPRD